MFCFTLFRWNFVTKRHRYIFEFAFEWRLCDVRMTPTWRSGDADAPLSFDKLILILTTQNDDRLITANDVLDIPDRRGQPTEGEEPSVGSSPGLVHRHEGRLRRLLRPLKLDDVKLRRSRRIGRDRDPTFGAPDSDRANVRRRHLSLRRRCPRWTSQSPTHERWKGSTSCFMFWITFKKNYVNFIANNNDYK